MAPRFLLSKHQRQKVSNEIYSLAFNGTAIQTQTQKQILKRRKMRQDVYFIFGAKIQIHFFLTLGQKTICEFLKKGL